MDDLFEGSITQVFDGKISQENKSKEKRVRERITKIMFQFSIIFTLFFFFFFSPLTHYFIF